MDHQPTSALAGRMIDFCCSSCGRKFTVKPEFAGRATRCPTCKQELVVPPPPADRTVTLAAARPSADIPGGATRAAGADEVTLDRAGDAAPARPPDDGLRDAWATVAASPAEAALHDCVPVRAGAGRYIVGAEIARGGMGTVLQATDCDIRREVAVKYLLDQSDQDKQLRFVEEAQITGQLEHPNIVPIHELGVDAQKRVFFSMKMVKGRSLAQVLDALDRDPQAEGKEYSLHRLLNIFVNVCNALAYAHSRGVVHRDLKPANVMIGDFGAVYVMDWGLAKVLRDGNSSEHTLPFAFALPPGHSAPAAPLAARVSGAAAIQHAAARSNPTSQSMPLGKVMTSREQPADWTQEGSVLGTPIYMPPEQATGQINAIDERSDIYSLGAILYQILTLKPPIDKSGGYAAIIKRVVERQIVPPALHNPARARAGHIPREVVAIAMKALAFVPNDRYQSVEFLRRDIELFLDGRSVSAKEDSRAELLVKFVKRNRPFSAATAAAVLLLTILVTWALVVNLRARRDADDAKRAYETEQKEKEARTRQAVPALVKAAQLEVHQRQLDDAFKHVNLALEYDPNNPDGRLLKARLLIVKQDFAGAAAELGKCLVHRPRDAQAHELKRLCDAVRPHDEDKSVLMQIAQHLNWHDYPTLTEEMLSQHGDTLAGLRQDLLVRYRERLETAWPQPQANTAPRTDPIPTLSLNEQGFHLKLVGDHVRDLALLKGMPLNSVDIICNGPLDLTALRGMPLKNFRLANVQRADLSVLAGMSLTAFELMNCHGPLELSVLRGMPLTTVVLENCNGIQDLLGLKETPLDSVRISGCHGLTDLSGLQGARLKTLQITGCANVRDLTPLKDLPLSSLNLAGCSTLQDLAPLQALPLAELDISATEVRDLAPLQGLPLTKLGLGNCSFLKDVSGLKGLMLKSLDLGGCSRVEDIAPLKGMPLHAVELAGTGVKDLAALKGMLLVRISLSNCRALTDLSALKGMPLNTLDLTGCGALVDLSPLRGMPLNWLSLAGCGEVVDLGPLQGTALNALQLTGCAKIADLSPLKEALLTQIDLRDCAGIKDLSGLQTMPFNVLELTGCTNLVSVDGLKGSFVNTMRITGCIKLESLTGLAALPLTQLDIQNCPRLQDLSGLRGLRLKELIIGGCAVKDLAPLKGMPLESLRLERCLELQDLAPLADLQLVHIRLPPQRIAGIEVLRKMPSLQTIDSLPAKQFWLKFDASKSNSQ